METCRPNRIFCRTECSDHIFESFLHQPHAVLQWFPNHKPWFPGEWQKPAGEPQIPHGQPTAYTMKPYWGTTAKSPADQESHQPKRFEKHDILVYNSSWKVQVKAKSLYSLTTSEPLFKIIFHYLGVQNLRYMRAHTHTPNTFTTSFLSLFQPLKRFSMLTCYVTTNTHLRASVCKPCMDTKSIWLVLLQVTKAVSSNSSSALLLFPLSLFLLKSLLNQLYQKK